MVDLRNYIKYLPNQHSVGCCTSSAALLNLEIQLSKQENYIRYSRLFTYYYSRIRAGRRGQPGVDLSNTFESMVADGVCPEKLWPFRISHQNQEPADLQRQSAIHIIKSYNRISYDRISNYLEQGIPVTVGMFTGKQFWKMQGTLEKNFYYPINNQDNRPSKGHAITIVGYDNNLHGGSWIAANSLGEKWGDRGYCSILYECFKDFGEIYSVEIKNERIDK